VLADHPDIGWVVQRNRQTHDLWHTLLGLGVLPHEEVLVHAFCWGHLGVPQSVFIVLFGAVKHMVLEARWRTLRVGLRAAYDAGRRAAPLWAVYWERHWDEPLAEVRRRLRVEPYASALD
jgi:ubiquinone biosynthesis protein COQ4